MAESRFQIKDYDFKNTFSLLLLTIINLLFCFKYVHRISLPLSAAVLACYIGSVVIWWYLTVGRRRVYIKWKVAFVLILFYIMSVSYLLFRISYAQLHVDRWEIIDLFWNSVRDGLYPYSAQTPQGNYPGAMPVYFLLYYPFYLLREVGVLTLVVILTSLYICYQKCDKYRFSFILFFVLTSPALLWELVTRSTILVNGAFVLLYFYVLVHTDYRKPAAMWLMAVLGAVVLCMRGVFVIPFIVWAIHALYRKEISFGKMLQFGMIFIVTFILIYLPFVIRWPQEFMTHNPFVIESSGLMPLPYTIATLIIAVLVGFLYRRNELLFFSSGICLLIVFGFYIGVMIYQIGWKATYMESMGDISYSLFSFPFLVMALVQRTHPRRYK